MSTPYVFNQFAPFHWQGNKRQAERLVAYTQLSHDYHAQTGEWFEPHGSWDVRYFFKQQNSKIL